MKRLHTYLTKLRTDKLASFPPAGLAMLYI